MWPTSFVKPEKVSRVCIRTYIFSDTTKVQKFLDFIKEKFPNLKVDVKQLDNGGISVCLTSSSFSSINIDNYTIKTQTKCRFYRYQFVGKYGGDCRSYKVSKKYGTYSGYTYTPLPINIHRFCTGTCANCCGNLIDFNGTGNKTLNCIYRCTAMKSR